MCDVDQIIERLKAELPTVSIKQLWAPNPKTADDGVWFIELPGRFGEVQIESSDGTCPFIVESDINHEILTGNTVDEVVQL